jgi:hypothetical protein
MQNNIPDMQKKNKKQACETMSSAKDVEKEWLNLSGK